MNPIVTIILFIIFIWIVFFFILKVLEIIYGQRLVNYFQSRSIFIQLFSITWTTTILNSPLKRLTQRFDRFWDYWFRIGNVIVISLIPISIGTLIYNLYILLSQQSSTNAVVTPILPGINFPPSHLIYLIVAFVISAAFHELGHAISCLQLKNRVNDIGINLFFVIPGAMVNVNSEDLNRTPYWNQLKVYGAGVWHNLTLSIFIYLIILPCLPFIVSPLYHYSNNELYVTNIPQGSSLNNQIFPGDHIISINECLIKNQSDFIQCIYNTIEIPQMYCLDLNIDKCINNTLNIRQCLYNDKIINLKKCDLQSTSSSSCSNLSQKQCIDISNYNYYLFNIEIKSVGRDNEMLTFIGTPQELWDSFTTNNYRARVAGLRSIDIPYTIHAIVNYIAAVSLGLGMMNVLPINALDGQHILCALLNVIIIRFTSLPREQEDKLFYKSLSIITWFSTILGLLNLILSFYYLFI